MQIRLPKSWRNQIKFLIFASLFFIVGCSVHTANSVRPSFSENTSERTGETRPSRRKNDTPPPQQQRVEETAPAATTASRRPSSGEQTQTTQRETPSRASANANRGGEFRRAAEQYLGAPYILGGTTRRGFDCSGFVWRVYQDVGHTDFQRTTAQVMFNRARPISRNALREGDLVFFHRPRKRNQIGHVGIYISDGRFIHSASTLGVAYSYLTDKHWSKYFAGFGRILP